MFLSAPRAAGAASLTEACPLGGIAPGLERGLYTRTMCQDATPSLTPRFWFIRSEDVSSPTLINEHQWFNAYPYL